MRILLAYDGSISADVAITDLKRAGLPPVAEILIVTAIDGGPEALAAQRAAVAADRVRSSFPESNVSSSVLSGPPGRAILETSEVWHPELVVVGTHGHSHVARLLLGSVTVELIHKAHCSVRVARPGRSSAEAPIRFLIGDDGSTEAAAVVRAIRRRTWPPGTEARVVAVTETLVPVVAGIGASTLAQEPASRVIREIDELERERLQVVAHDSTQALREAGLKVTATIVDGEPREALLAEAEQFNADAIFVGARGLGRVERFLLGSVSSYVVTHAHCTVEVVRE